MSATFEIARLGAQGDGIAETETGPVFIHYALPGETVTAPLMASVPSVPPTGSNWNHPLWTEAQQADRLSIELKAR